jgi:hypothetical protein
MMKVPTIGLGVSYLTTHQNQYDKLLAAMIDKQIPVDDTNLDYWFEDIFNDAKKGRCNA